MSSHKISCMFCEVEKDEGFAVDMGYGNTFALSWHPGKPESGWLYNTKVDSDKQMPIIAMRCPQCGHLDLFADRRLKKSKLDSYLTGDDEY